jgi:hypothetical protein
MISASLLPRSARVSATKRRRGHPLVVTPGNHPALDALRIELDRFPDVDLAAVAHGARAALLAGIGFARPPSLREVVGVSKGGWKAALDSFREWGLLRLDAATKYRISDGHRPLQVFCHAVCDLETRKALEALRLVGPRVLWTRSNEAFVAYRGERSRAPSLKNAGYTAAASKGLAFISRDRYAMFSQRAQTWGDTVLQCLLSRRARS